MSLDLKFSTKVQIVSDKCQVLSTCLPGLPDHACKIDSKFLSKSSGWSLLNQELPVSKHGQPC